MGLTSLSLTGDWSGSPTNPQSLVTHLNHVAEGQEEDEQVAELEGLPDKRKNPPSSQPQWQRSYVSSSARTFSCLTTSSSSQLLLYEY
jgi:hypothetical protein